jgi:hypothetical protein
LVVCLVDVAIAVIVSGVGGACGNHPETAGQHEETLPKITGTDVAMISGKEVVRICGTQTSLNESTVIVSPVLMRIFHVRVGSIEGFLNVGITVGIVVSVVV